MKGTHFFCLWEYLFTILPCTICTVAVFEFFVCMSVCCLSPCNFVCAVI